MIPPVTADAQLDQAASPAAAGTNAIVELVARADPRRAAVVERRRDGTRRVWSFGDVQRLSGAMAGDMARRGVLRGDVVATSIGSRIEWVAAMLACFRLGAVVLSSPEQLRGKDLRDRFAAVPPRLVVADERNGEALRAAGWSGETIWAGDELDAGTAVPDPARVREDDAALMAFTSGTTGAPKVVVHGQRYLRGQRLQARAWFAAPPGGVAWCTAAPGWSKATRNTFIAPWLCGAAALLHDARFDPSERLALIEEEGVSMLCMSPTEYRVLARRAELRPLPALGSAVAAGEALDAPAIEAWREGAGVRVRDGYGQTETGHLTGVGPGDPAPPGSMGRPLPGIRMAEQAGELVVEAATVPTFFLGYRGAPAPPRMWRTGDLVSIDEGGYLWFEGRSDDVIVSSGYRIGPDEVEAALRAHPAVGEVAVVAAPDEDRGAVVRAVVVVAEGTVPSDALAQELKEFAKQQTAPYKHPRRIDFATELPRTASGKVRRSALREP